MTERNDQKVEAPGAASQQALPLAGIRVVDYTQFLAGPYASRCLAGMGAEVIKVERPKEGDPSRTHTYLTPEGISGYYLLQNMGKKGLCVNTKDPRGLELLRKLVATADVFIENYRPGALKKLGLGYEELSKINPRLIYCSISAFGYTGPDSPRPGYGAIAEARSGAMAQLGVPGQPPPLLRMPIADIHTATNAVAAICAALLGRVRSQKGQHLDIALYDCMVAMHDYAIQCYTLSGGREIPVQTGHDLPQSTVYGVFPARDGNLVIAAQMDASWKRLAKLIGGDALAADARFYGAEGRNAHNKEILALVRKWALEQPSVKACIAALDAADVACAPINRIDEVLADPQTAARGLVIEQEHPVLGRIKLSNIPFKFSDCDVTPRTIAPMIGQHNREIAAELGYGAAEIKAMLDEGVLYAEPSAKG
ncbi:MAG: CoA transferase [Deltaproteobacteria bacterium]|nr:CoA transferase [Deltaproteobacteria bacterium]